MSSLIGGTRPYSSGFEPGSRASQDYVMVPFTVYIDVTPQLGTGKRFDLVRNLEKLAWQVEQRLLLDTAFPVGTHELELTINTPVAVTPQIGDHSARLTITGFNKVSRQNAAPTTDVTLISNGTDQGEPTSTISGNLGGSLSAGQDTTTTVDQEVADLRDALVTRLSDSPTTPVQYQSALPTTISAIEYNGVKFGVKKQGGRSFPL